MTWTCPRGHARPLGSDLTAVRELTDVLALTHFCQSCDTSYLLPPETQHRVLQIFEERALRTWLRELALPIGGETWRFAFVSLRLIARFPPDAAELETIGSADESAPRVRIVVRVPLDVLRAGALLKLRLRNELERRLVRGARP